MNTKLFGVIPPAVTPFTPDDRIDVDAFRAEVAHLLDCGAHGITLSGSTGEGHTLTIEESCQLARIAREEAAGRVPVISGIIQDSTSAVIRYGKALKDEGVDALQITPVHYLFTPGIDGTLRYYEEIGDQVKLEIVIYNVVPWNTIDVPTLMKLAEQEWIVGVKQSGGDIHKLADLLRAVRTTGSELRVLSAVDALMFPSYLMGAHGSIAAILAALPRQSVALWNACQEGNLDLALRIHEATLPLWRLLEVPADMSARVKATVNLQGRTVGAPRRPLLPVSPSVERELREALEISGELESSHPVAS